MKELNKKLIDTIVRFALKEDIQTGDITSRAVLDDREEVDAIILTRQKGIICGMNIIETVFSAVDENLKFRPMVNDGDHIEPDQEIAFIEGSAKSILKAERTALNFLGFLSGISTKTREMVDAVEAARVKIYDTRKTIPLHRYLQKYAVTTGGGFNHRSGLWDMVLIKDNHIRIFGMQKKIKDTGIVIKEIIRQTRASVQKNIRIEIEVETLKECEYALSEEPDVIMLDNMTPGMITEAVALRRNKGLEGKVLFEVSGGITMDNIAAYSVTGVDIISTGSITAAVLPVDFSLEIILNA